MNNHDCAVAVLEAHREARRWTDDAVAADLLAQLGLDPSAEAKNAVLPAAPGITEDEVVALEAAAKEAMDKAHAARAELHGQVHAASDAMTVALMSHSQLADAPVPLSNPIPSQQGSAQVGTVPPAAHPAFPAPPAAPAPVMPAHPVAPAAS